MEYPGHVENGVVVLDGAADLPEGTRVRVLPVEAEHGTAGTINEKLLRLAGKAKGLPSDLSRNHDHYLHGQPKR